MLGAIAGDTIGSVYEFNNHKTKDFPLFTAESCYTDDSILSVAVADVILNGGDYGAVIQAYAQRYPNPCGGYGARFQAWAQSSSPEPYGSWGNGSAMRVSPVGWAFETWDEVMAEAQKSAEVTHNHLEGIKGAQATAGAIFLARTGSTKAAIRDRIEQAFGYDLGRDLDTLRPAYEYSESCQKTVPEAMIAFLASTDFEDAIRNAISLGGDSDTLTCITGAIAEAFYGGVPDNIAAATWSRLDEPLRSVSRQFRERFVVPSRAVR